MCVWGLNLCQLSRVSDIWRSNSLTDASEILNPQAHNHISVFMGLAPMNTWAVISEKVKLMRTWNHEHIHHKLELFKTTNEASFILLEWFAEAPTQPLIPSFSPPGSCHYGQDGMNHRCSSVCSTAWLRGQITLNIFPQRRSEEQPWRRCEAATISPSLINGARMKKLT